MARRTEELLNAAYAAVDEDPIKVLNALGAALGVCDQMECAMPGVVAEIRRQVGLALGIQEGSGNG